MKKFKVLHVVVAKIWGGGEQYVYDICKEMQRQGHTIFIAVDKTNCMFQQRYAEVATVLPVNLYFVAGLFAVNELKNIIASESIDVINCHSGHGVLLCLLLKFLSGKKLVLFKHNALLAKNDIYHVWLRENVDANICVSKLVLSLQTQGLKESEKKKFHLVYNGIDLTNFNKYQNLHKDSQEFIIGYAGRLAPNKGMDILLMAFALLHKKHSNTRLKIVGANENRYLEQINVLIRDLDLQNVVEYGGIEKDMEKFYKSLDVFVLPSIVKEAFGLVLCEAMYCGVPVVTTNSGAQEEIIENGKDGIIVSPGDINDLYKGLDLIYSDNEKRMKLAEMAKNKVESKFNIIDCANRLIKITHVN